MTEIPPPVQPIGQYPAPAAPARGSRAMAGAALGLGIAALIPCLGAVTGIIGIILGIVALVKRKAGQGMAIAGIVVGGFGLLIGQAIGLAILLPAFSGAVSSAQKAACQANVRMIGRSIDMYKQDHDKYPADLFELVSEDLIPGSTLRCPGASEGTAPSLPLKDGARISSGYFYLPPAADADPRTIVACDFRWNHKDGRSVLYVDDTVRFLEEEVFLSQLALPHNAALAEALRDIEPP